MLCCQQERTVYASWLLHHRSFDKLHNFALWCSVTFLFHISIVLQFSITHSASADFSLSAPQTSGLGVSPTSIGGISLAVRRIPQCLLFLLRLGAFFFAWAYLFAPAFDAPSSKAGAISDFTLRRLGQRSFSLTLLREALGIIISKNVNWLGAVSVQWGRQSGEKFAVEIIPITKCRNGKSHWHTKFERNINRQKECKCAIILSWKYSISHNAKRGR